MSALRACMERQHPRVLAFFCLGGLAIVLASFNVILAPALLLLSVVLSAVLRGASGGLRSLCWQLPLLGIVALVNPLFSASGSTEIFHTEFFTVYAESLLYGFTAGCVLVSSMLWAGLLGHYLVADKLMALAGPRFPLLALLMSFTLRLIPHEITQAREIYAARRVVSATKRLGFVDAAIMANGLLANSLEDALERSVVIKARFWDESRKRSLYEAYAQSTTDKILSIGVFLCAVLVVLLFVVTVSAGSFYPVIVLPSAFQLAVCLIVALVFFGIPVLIYLAEEVW